jgi:hypothetical protein
MADPEAFGQPRAAWQARGAIIGVLFSMLACQLPAATGVRRILAENPSQISVWISPRWERTLAGQSAGQIGDGDAVVGVAAEHLRHQRRLILDQRATSWLGEGGRSSEAASRNQEAPPGHVVADA